MDIDWTRYNTDPAYKTEVSRRIERNADLATACLVTARIGVTLINGTTVHVYAMPWDCLDAARSLYDAIGPRRVRSVSINARDGALYLFPSHAAARRARSRRIRALA